MNKPKLYLLALYARQTDPSWRHNPADDFSRLSYPEGPESLPISLWAQGAVAMSEEDTRAEGMRLILEACPVEEGWTNHAVAANTIHPDTFEKIVREVYRKGWPKMADDAVKGIEFSSQSLSRYWN